MNKKLIVLIVMVSFIAAHAKQHISDDMVIALADSKKNKITADQFFDFMADSFSGELKDKFIALLQEMAQRQKEGIRADQIAHSMQRFGLSKEAAEKEFDQTWTPKLHALREFEREIDSIKITNAEDRKHCMNNFGTCVTNVLQRPIVSSEKDKSFKDALRKHLYQWLSKQ